MQKQPFSPNYGSGVALTTISGSTPFTGALNPRSKNIVVANTGTAVFYIRVGTGAQVATAADMPIMPGHAVSLTKADGQDSIATFAAAAGGTGTVISGEGFMY